MIIYPAIDIKNGKCVRLTQGLSHEEKVYFDSPEEVAKMWQGQGAKWLHVVDLDGAFDGKSMNYPTIERIIKAIGIPLQIGGGIRSMASIESWLNLGVKRVILGTKALEDSSMLKRAIDEYADRIVVSIDAKDGFVTTEGWVKTSRIKAVDFAQQLEALGIKTIIYTDISRDGMLAGPNFKEIKELKNSVKIEVIASGGVTTVEDVIKLKEMKLAGAIVGKALYEGRITIKDVEGALV